MHMKSYLGSPFFWFVLFTFSAWAMDSDVGSDDSTVFSSLKQWVTAPVVKGDKPFPFGQKASLVARNYRLTFWHVSLGNKIVMDLISGMKITIITIIITTIIITIIITIITITLLKMYIFFLCLFHFVELVAKHFFPWMTPNAAASSSVDCWLTPCAPLHMFPSFWWWLVNVTGGFVETTRWAGGFQQCSASSPFENPS